MNISYENWVNSNWAYEGKLKGLADSVGLFKHLIQPTARKEGREFLNLKPSLDPLTYDLKTGKIFKSNSKEAQKVFEVLKLKAQEALEKSPKGPHKKPFRFFTTTLNVPPTAKNKVVIEDWVKGQIEFFKSKFGNDLVACALHTQESRPHLHFVLKHFQKTKEGFKFKYENFEAGLEGRKFHQALTDQHQTLIKEFCEKHKLEYKQDPTTAKGQSRKIKIFRKSLMKLETGEALSEREQKVLRAELNKLSKTQGISLSQALAYKVQLKTGKSVSLGDYIKSLQKQPPKVKEVVKEKVRVEYKDKPIDPELQANYDFGLKCADLLHQLFPKAWENNDEIGFLEKVRTSILTNREKSLKYNKEHPHYRGGPVR